MPIQDDRSSLTRSVESNILLQEALAMSYSMIKISLEVALSSGIAASGGPFCSGGNGDWADGCSMFDVRCSFVRSFCLVPVPVPVPVLWFSVKMRGLFAFSHRTVGAGMPDPGWHIFDADKELDRMGVLKARRNNVASPWR